MTPDIFYLLEKHFYLFLLIFFRILFLFMIFPVFAATFFPTKVKLALSLVLALSLTPYLSHHLIISMNPFELIYYMISDFFLMFIIALFLRFILGGLQLGGELVGLQMGFGLSQTFDPSSGVSMPVIAQFLYFIFLLLFFTLDIHHFLLYFLVKSFYELPPGVLLKEENIFKFLIKKSHLVFDIAVKILAPLMVFMLLINIVLAIIGRLLPQINVLFVSFPLTLGLGLFFFGMMLFLVPRIFNQYFNQFNQFLFQILKY
ncbi:MAG: flagellar biosynthetic protein FliR [Caldimicrobium sp.]|nr:flagellar biosynthetic protein FliR [Caldimicrobium sp.]